MLAPGVNMMQYANRDGVKRFAVARQVMASQMIGDWLIFGCFDSRPVVVHPLLEVLGFPYILLIAFFASDAVYDLLRSTIRPPNDVVGCSSPVHVLGVRRFHVWA